MITGRETETWWGRVPCRKSRCWWGWEANPFLLGSSAPCRLYGTPCNHGQKGLGTNKRIGLAQQTQGSKRMRNRLLAFAGSEEKRAEGKVKHDPPRSAQGKPWITCSHKVGRMLSSATGSEELSLSRAEKVLCPSFTQQWSTHNRYGFTFIFFTPTPLTNEPLPFHITEETLKEKSERQG